MNRLYCLLHFAPFGLVFIFACFSMADAHEGYILTCAYGPTLAWGHSMVCGGGGGGASKTFSGHTKKKFPDITKFPLTSRNFRENTKFFARILHRFLPDRKKYAYVSSCFAREYVSL